MTVVWSLSKKRAIPGYERSVFMRAICQQAIRAWAAGRARLDDKITLTATPLAAETRETISAIVFWAGAAPPHKGQQAVTPKSPA